MSKSLDNQEVILFDYNQGGNYLQVSVNVTSVRVCVKGNYGDFSDVETRHILQLILDTGADRFLIFTGDNQLGQLLAKELVGQGKVILLVTPGADITELGDQRFLKVVHTENAELDSVRYLDYIGIYSTPTLGEGEQEEIDEITKLEKPVSFNDESTFF